MNPRAPQQVLARAEAVRLGVLELCAKRGRLSKVTTADYALLLGLVDLALASIPASPPPPDVVDSAVRDIIETALPGRRPDGRGRSSSSARRAGRIHADGHRAEGRLVTEDLDDLLERSGGFAGDAMPAIVETRRKPRRGLVSATPADPTRQRRNRGNRNRGATFEREVARVLGGRRVGPLLLPWDVEVPGYMRVQTKYVATLPSIPAALAWLAAIPSEPELRAVAIGNAAGRGTRGARVILAELGEYERWHGAWGGDVVAKAGWPTLAVALAWLARTPVDAGKLHGLGLHYQAPNSMPDGRLLIAELGEYARWHGRVEA